MHETTRQAEQKQSDPMHNSTPQAPRKALRLGPLTAEEAGPLAAWTFPAYRHLLTLQPAPRLEQRGDPCLVQPLAFGAYLGDRPVGLALGCIPIAPEGSTRAEEKGPELLSINSSPARRRQGIGGALLAQLEAKVANTSWRQLHAIYSADAAASSPIECLLDQRGWQPAHLRRRIIKIPIERVLSFTWFQRLSRRARRSQELEVVPWGTIREEQINTLRAWQKRDGWIPEGIVPWAWDPEPLEKKASLGLLRGEKLVGWMIAHCLGADTLRFSYSYLHPNFSRHGLIFSIWTESLLRAQEAGYRRISIALSVEYPEMYRFVERYFLPSSLPGEVLESRERSLIW